MNVCRACANPLGSRSPYFWLFGVIENGRSIADTILDCTGIEMHISDGFPKKICSKCLDELKISYDFKKKCENSDEIFKKEVKFEPQDDEFVVEYLEDDEFVTTVVGESIPIEEFIFEELKEDEVFDVETEEAPTKLKCKEEDADEEFGTSTKSKSADDGLKVKIETPKRKAESDDEDLVETDVGDTPRILKRKALSLEPLSYKNIKQELQEVEKLLAKVKGMENKEIDAKQLDLLHKLESSLSKTEESIKRSTVNTPPEKKKPPVTRSMQNVRQQPKPSTSKLKGLTQRCCGCDEKFSSTQELEEHAIATHKKDVKNYTSEQTVRQCRICYDTFFEYNYTTGRTIHKNIVFFARLKYINVPCCLCDTSFGSLEELKKHAVDDHQVQRPETKVPNQTNECDVCFKRFKGKKEYYRKHKRGFKFRKLEDEAKKHSELQREFEVEDTNEKRCCRCTEKYDTEEELWEHAKIHQSLAPDTDMTHEKPYKCDICWRYFNNLPGLQLHKIRPYRVKTIFCTTCGDSFAEMRTLRLHEITHKRAAAAGSYTCDICPKNFKTSVAFEEHMGLHAGEGFTCHICGMMKSSKKRLAFHIATHHTDEKPYSCKICSKKFRYHSLIQVHMRVHTKEKKYHCGYCPKGFSHYSDCKRHEMSHTGEYPHICKECGRKFTRKTHYEQHSCKKVAKSI